MSQNWIRGSRCNVDNCRTHYYKIIDGQRVCQYGHVYEGHIEFNDEEDENFVVTRRLNIPGQSQNNPQSSQINPTLHRNEEKRRLYGYAARELYFKCFQCILKSQVQNVMKYADIPEILETVVKKFWIDYLTNVLNSNLSRVDGETTENYDSLTTDASDITYRFNKIPPLIDTLAILYISFRYLSLPLYTNDLIMWASASKIPYMKAGYEVPKRLRSRLSTILLSKLEPRRPPFKGELNLAVSKIVTKIGLNGELRFNYQPLLMKLVRELILPPRIYQATKNFIQLFSIDFKIPIFQELANNTSEQQRYLPLIRKFPELKLISCLIIVTKLFFLKPIWISKKITPTWKDWKQILENLTMNKDDNRNFDNLLTSLITSDKIDYEILEWDQIKTEKYLDWFESTFIDKKSLKDPYYSVFKKRLNKIFELDEREVSESLIKDLHSTENAYVQLFEKKMDYKEPDEKMLNNEELLQIEATLVENLNLNFGITVIQLKSGIHSMEQKLMNELTK